MLIKGKHSSLLQISLNYGHGQFENIESSGLYYKTITIVIMTIVVKLQIVASLMSLIDDTS